MRKVMQFYKESLKCGMKATHTSVTMAGEEDEDIGTVLLPFLREANISNDYPFGNVYDLPLDSAAAQPEQQQQQQDTRMSPEALLLLPARAHRSAPQHPSSFTQHPAPSSMTSTTHRAATTSSSATSHTHQQPLGTRPSEQPLPKPAKRRPTPQQKVAELERKVAGAMAKLERLSLDNTFMSERVRMLELVIDVREVQLARLSAIHQGLQHNPFETMGKTVQEMKSCTPHEAAAFFTDLFGRVALKLAPLLPVLERHPELIVGPVTGAVDWAALRDRRVAVPEGVEAGDVAAWATLGPLPVAPAVVNDVYQLIMLMRDVHRIFMHLFFLSPHVIMMGGVHIQAVNPAEHASWQGLATCICRLARGQDGESTRVAGAAAVPGAGACAGDESQVPHSEASSRRASEAAGEHQDDPARPPLVAPTSHWKSVVSHLRLTERQKLQSAVLCDIMARPLSEVLKQRTRLVLALMQLNQDQDDGAGGGGPHSTWPADATAAAAAAAVPGHLDVRHGAASGGVVGAVADVLVGGAAGPVRQVSQEQLLRHSSGSGPLLAIPFSGGAGGGGSFLFSRQSTGRSSGDGGGPSRTSTSSRLPDLVVSKSAEVLQEEESLLRKLQHTLAKESALIVLASEVFYRFILTPVQVPLIMINAYPYGMDSLAILHAIADEYYYLHKEEKGAGGSR